MYISYYLQNKSFSGISKAQIRSALEESFSEFLFSNGNSKKDHLFWGYFCLSGFEKSRSNLSSRFMTFVKVGIWFLINEDVLTLTFKFCHRQIWNIFFCWYHCKHIFGKKDWAFLIDLLKVKTIFYIIVFIVKRMAGK